MVGAISDLEKEFEETERKRLQAERLRSGEAVSEIEKLLSLAEDIALAGEFKHLTSRIDFHKLAEELHAQNNQVVEQSLALQQQASEIGELRTQIKLMQAALSDVKQQLNDLVSRIGENPELEREALTKLNDYLNKWL